MNRARPSMRVGGRSQPEVMAPDRVTDSELWLMLLSMVRYSMGRSTYIVDDACQLVMKFRNRLKPEQVQQIAKEVAEAAQRAENDGVTLGMEIDHARWKRLVEQLRK